MESKFGLMQALEQGGPLTWGVVIILAIMSLGSWYIIITKYLDQRKVLAEARISRRSSGVRRASPTVPRSSTRIRPSARSSTTGCALRTTTRAA